LTGAVKAIHAHEDHTKGAPPIERIILSTRISDSAKHHTRYICGFYSLVFIGLCALVAVTGQKWSAMTTPPSSSNKFEFKFERAPTEGVDLKIVPKPSPVGVTPTTSTTAVHGPSPGPPSTKTKVTP
jgi:hypothetical protein